MGVIVFVIELILMVVGLFTMPYGMILWAVACLMGICDEVTKIRKILEKHQ